MLRPVDRPDCFSICAFFGIGRTGEKIDANDAPDEVELLILVLRQSEAGNRLKIVRRLNARKLLVLGPLVAAADLGLSLAVIGAVSLAAWAERLTCLCPFSAIAIACSRCTFASASSWRNCAPAIGS